MNNWGEQDTPLPSLLDGDYCEETTEEYDDGYIPYSLRLLQQRKRINDEKILERNENSNEL